jgi:hypothetical protein
MVSVHFGPYSELGLAELMVEVHAHSWSHGMHVLQHCAT